MSTARAMYRADGFRDRRDAGRRLARRLAPFAGERPVVLGLPRGGVPVAAEVARALGAPLDVLVARKVGAPGNPEYGIGAIAEDGVRVLNEPALHMLQLTPEELERATARAERELRERLVRYRTGRGAVQVKGRTTIVVDDGLATGGTARAALRALRGRDPARLILAVPVGAPETIAALAGECDEVVCLLAPEPMRAIGYWYEDFGQTTDAEVLALLGAAPAAARGLDDPPDSPDPPGPPDPSGRPPARREVQIAVAGAGAERIAGDLTVPEQAPGIVVFAHGSGSSRHSPRNRDVAGRLNAAGVATLLIDLLTTEEERWRANVFDIELLAGRLAAAVRWVREQPELMALGLGFFGASTGAGAALWAAAELGEEVQAVVSRGGRPDLAAPRLHEVRSPTLLIVGGHDRVVLDLNRQALARLSCEARLEIVPGATHLFEEPGTLDAVAQLAAGWFAQHLSRRDAVAHG